MKAFPRDADCKKVRHIGIESELGVGPSNREELPPEVRAVVTKRGILQSIGNDGGGRELRTNPISVKCLHQVRGPKYIREYYEVLRPVTNVLQSGGTHIHISILDDDHPNMESNATALAIAFHRQFQKISGRETGWAQRCHTRTVEETKGFLDNRKARYGGGARAYSRTGYMLGPTIHQTLEFRGPRGSNNAEEILAWADFMETVVKVANRESVDGVKFSDLITGKRIAEYVKTLATPLTKTELNQTINVMALA